MSLYKDKRHVSYLQGVFILVEEKHTPTSNDESLNTLSLPHSILKSR